MGLFVRNWTGEHSADFRNVVTSIPQELCYHFGSALKDVSDLWVRIVSSRHVVSSFSFPCGPFQGGSCSICTLTRFLLCSLWWSRTYLRYLLWEEEHSREEQGNCLSTNPTAPSHLCVRAAGLSSPCAETLKRLQESHFEHTHWVICSQREEVVSHAESCLWIWECSVLRRAWALAGWQGGNMPAKGLVTHPGCKLYGTR